MLSAAPPPTSYRPAPGTLCHLHGSWPGAYCRVLSYHGPHHDVVLVFSLLLRLTYLTGTHLLRALF